MLDKLLAIPPTFYSADGKKLSPLAYIFLVMLSVAFFTPGLITMPPTDRDESYFAQASKQMIETGNYTDIRFQDAPRYKKPIGIYWLQSTAVRLVNPHHLDQIWAYRLPSLAGAIIAVVMTAALGSLLFTPQAGLLAAIMLAGCVLLNVEARLAKTDAALLGCIMVTMYALARAYVGQAGRWGSAFAFWTALALGILIKGPIILLPVCATLIWLKISDKSLAWFRALRPLPGFIYMLALILPWFLAIMAQSHGAFIEQSAGHDMLAKLWQGQDRGSLPPGLHLLALPIAFFPFALFIILAAPDAWKNRRDRDVKFCLGWIIPTWVVFELSFTKLPHYVLPTYPALALIAAKFLLDGLPTAANATRRLPLALTIAVWFMVGGGFAAGFAFLPAFSDDRWMWPQVAAGVVIFTTQILAILQLPRDKTASILTLAIGSLLFMTVVFGQTLPALRHVWVSREIVQSLSASNVNPCVSKQVIATGYHEPSLVFLAGTNTLLPATGADAASEIKKNFCGIAVIDPKNQQAFLDGFAGSDPKPIEIGTVEGLNAGHGAHTMLTLYSMPPGQTAP